jgi:hypothetical protein
MSIHTQIKTESWSEVGEMKHDVTTTGKFIKLLRFVRSQLSSPEPLVAPATITVGILDRLKQFTTKAAPAGDVGREHDNDEISEAIGWLGDSDQLIAALVRSGWLIECDVHRLIYADWKSSVPSYVLGNLRRHGRDIAEPQIRSKNESARSNLLEQPAIASSLEQPAFSTPPHNKT